MTLQLNPIYSLGQLHTHPENLQCPKNRPNNHPSPSNYFSLTQTYRNSSRAPPKNPTFQSDTNNPIEEHPKRTNNIVKKPPIILDDDKSRISGKVKFLDEKKNFGFIISDEDG
jgi:cold shock CspA family protein